MIARMAADPQPFPRSLSLAVHEFRTPVTVVSGYLRMLLKEQAGPLTEKQRKMLEEADKSCARIGALVNEMSDLGKLESHDLALARQPVDLAQVVTEAAGSMREGQDRGVVLDVRIDGGPLTVLGDRARLTSAVAALLHSALRERGDAGTVVAECAPARDQRPWAILVIGDASLLPSLRDARHAPPPFDEYRGGMGLALPVARRVVEMHDGALWSATGSQSRAASGLRLPLHE